MKDKKYSQDLRVISDLLMEERKKAGVFQEDLAEMLAKPQSFVSRVEAGKRRLDIVELRRVLDALGVDFMEFMAQVDAALKKPGKAGKRRKGPSRKGK